MARYQKIREYEKRLASMTQAAQVGEASLGTAHLKCCPARAVQLGAPCAVPFLQEEQRATNVALWQARSDEKQLGLLVQRRLEALTLRREADLQARRQRLADKLFAEEQAYRQELVQSKETPEQRRAKLAARAQALADRREAERQALARTLEEQAFVENCDVLRDTNSKRILYRTLDERTAQVRMSSIVLAAATSISDMHGSRHVCSI
jgi:hypothetical protein